MATCNFSSPFDITITGSDLDVAKVFTAPRDFKVVGITAVNGASAASTLTCTGSTAGIFTATTAVAPAAGPGIVQAQAQVGPTAPVSVLNANCEITYGETITVTTGHDTVTTVVIHCVAPDGGQAVTIS